MSKQIVLISCANQKLPARAKAKDLYISTLFKLSLAYAKKLQPDTIFILSAKHGLLPLEKEIEPYEKTLNTMRSAEVRAWADNVLTQLNNHCRIDETKFIFLAGAQYRRYLLPHIKHSQTPLQGLRIGEQLQKLNALLS